MKQYIKFKNIEQFNDFINNTLRNEINKEVPWLVQNFSVTEKQAQLIIKSCTNNIYYIPYGIEDKLIDGLNLFIELFGNVNKLCQFLEKEYYIRLFNKKHGERYRLYGTMYTNYKWVYYEGIFRSDMYIPFMMFRNDSCSIFSWGYNTIKKRVDNLCNLFNLSEEKCIELIIQNPRWIYHQKARLNKHFAEAARYWELEITIDNESKLYNAYFLIKEQEKVEQSINRLAEYYQVEKSLIKKLMIEHPFMLSLGIEFFIKNKITREIFEKPWLLSCFTVYSYGLFGGYKTFENLILTINQIEKNFGQIVDLVRTEEYDCEFLGVITKKEDDYYLVSLGSNCFDKNERKRRKLALNSKIEESEKIMSGIFGNEFSINVEAHQEGYLHHEYFSKVENCEFETIINNVCSILDSSKNSRNYPMCVFDCNSNMTENSEQAESLCINERRLFVCFLGINYKYESKKVHVVDFDSDNMFDDFDDLECFDSGNMFDDFDDQKNK